MEVDLDPSLDGIEGQGRRSKVKVKHENHVFQPSTRKRGQGQRSRLKVKFKGHKSRSPQLRSLSGKEVRVKGQHVKGQISRSHDQGHY